MYHFNDTATDTHSSMTKVVHITSKIAGSKWYVSPKKYAIEVQFKCKWYLPLKTVNSVKL